MDLSTPAAVPPPRSSRWPLVVAMIAAGAVGLCLCAIVTVGVLSLLGRRVETPTIITATDGQSQLTVPSTWTTQTDLNEVAELQVANLRQEQYVIVLTENKSDFVGVDLDLYADETLAILLESLAINGEPTRRALTVNNKPALQYQVRGTINNLQVVYWITSIEGTHNYYQVAAWTLASKAEQNAPVFEQVVQSFQEVIP
jgi:hypothetical protein